MVSDRLGNINGQAVALQDEAHASNRRGVNRNRTWWCPVSFRPDGVGCLDLPSHSTAPTGSGKTTVFELAFLRMMKDNDFMEDKPLAVYMAPTKVCCLKPVETYD